MLRLAVVGLLALACGGESGAWDELNRSGEGGDDAGTTVAGSASGGMASVEPAPSAGTAPTDTAGSGTVAVGGSAGSGSGGASQSAGSGTVGSGGATAGQSSSGSGGSVAGASSGGSSGAGGNDAAGGEPAATECASEMLDCTSAVGCETWMADHDNCGECGHKCGLSQVCKRGGSVGAWTFYCISP